MACNRQKPEDGDVVQEFKIERVSAGSLSTSSDTPSSTLMSKSRSSMAIHLSSSPTVLEEAEKADGTIDLRRDLFLYLRAIVWSMLISLALLMEGYSTVLLPGLFAMSGFQHKFGEPLPVVLGSFEISAGWQAALVNCALGGQIVGLVLTGYLADKLGYRKILQCALVAFALSVFIPFFAQTKLMLVVGQFVLGIPLGVFQSICSTYATEVAPAGLRPYLCTYINASWVMGQLFASVVLRAMVNCTTEWSYKLPFALQWIFPLPLFVIVSLAPESPWYLVRIGKTEEAKESLRRLRTKRKDQPKEEFERRLIGILELIIQTTRKEKELEKAASFKDCFKGADRRRTEISCATWAIQTLCGSTFMGFSTYFYEQAGLGRQHAFTISLVQFALGLLGVGLSWLLMTKFGRRTLYIFGQILTFACVLLIGVLSILPSNSSLRWSIAALLLSFTITYNATIGPICYAIVPEIPSARLRTRTVCLARISYNTLGISANIVTPMMLNPTAWGWGGKMGFFWSGTCSLGIVWSWFRLPEPKGKNFDEINVLFEERVPARKFKSTIVTLQGHIVSREDSRA